VKSNVGHLFSAAGIAGLLKAILAVERGEIPPTLFCDAPNPRFEFASAPFFPNRQLRPWAGEPHARVAGVSAFGLGGTNAHAIVSGAPSASAPRRAPLAPPAFRRRRLWLEREVPSSRAPAAVVVASLLDLRFDDKTGNGVGA
jgi:acyl transferase domain-containing protein